jgi:mono/diheme cytochrome c family protein
MKEYVVAVACLFSLLIGDSAFAVALPPGNAEAGKQLVVNSCTVCHAPMDATAASDQAPPLSFLARDRRADPRWVRAWLMDPHPPMPGIMLSRQQVADVMAYLATLPTD